MADILPGIQYVIDNSTLVKINKDKIKEFCDKFDKKEVKHWVDEAPFDISKLDDDDKLNFLFIFNSLSFSYWGDPKWTIESGHDGSWALIECLGMAVDKIKPEYLVKITKQDFDDILKGNIRIPLFQERYNIMNEVSTVLIKKFDGEFRNVVEQAEGNALKLLDLIINNFPSFTDVRIYKEKQIMFYKRAQLLVADIFQMFKGKGYGDLENVEKLTACADYKLPQILRKLGILEYSKELAEKIDSMIELKQGSEEEVEIRAATIWAIELMKEQISGVDAIHINDHIWLLSQKKSPDDKPYHRVRGICY
ncbi:queuosine salvage family protein [candidate division KSB1 bacterium]